MALSRRVVAEALGTAFLLAAAVGSGIKGDKLAGGNTAIALLANTVATGAALITLIFAFGPISGAHFNPAVEFIATFGLLSVIRGCTRLRSDAVPLAVGLYITAAYWFTASTSFANSAATKYPSGEILSKDVLSVLKAFFYQVIDLRNLGYLG